MNRIFTFSALSLFALFLQPLTLFANIAEGEALERQMWTNMKSGAWEAVEKHMAPFFQSIHQDRARNKTEEMKLIRNLKLGDYTISEMKVTEGKDTYVITYMIAVNETIDSEKLSKAMQPRLSVWKKIDGTWQWTAHANLNPIQYENASF